MQKIKSNNPIGFHLEDVSYYLLLDRELGIEEAKTLVKEIVKGIRTELVFLKVNKLPPGFDITAGIKESVIYLGYWPEYNFIRIFVSSCKEYNPYYIEDLIKRFFDIEGIVTKIFENKRVYQLANEVKWNKNHWTI